MLELVFPFLAGASEGSAVTTTGPDLSTAQLYGHRYYGTRHNEAILRAAAALSGNTIFGSAPLVAAVPPGLLAVVYQGTTLITAHLVACSALTSALVDYTYALSAPERALLVDASITPFDVWLYWIPDATGAALGIVLDSVSVVVTDSTSTTLTVRAALGIPTFTAGRATATAMAFSPSFVIGARSLTAAIATAGAVAYGVTGAAFNGRTAGFATAAAVAFAPSRAGGPISRTTLLALAGAHAYGMAVVPPVSRTAGLAVAHALAFNTTWNNNTIVILGTAPTIVGESFLSLTYIGLPTVLMMSTNVFRGNSAVTIGLVVDVNTYGGTLVTLTDPSFSTSERLQFGAPGVVVT